MWALRLAVAACGLALLVACAHQGREEEPEARRYREHCGRCHTPFPRHAYRAEDWRAAMGRMAPLSQLDDREAEELLQWLQAGADK